MSGGTANVATSYSDYSASGDETIGAGGAGAFTAGPGTTDADPAFVSAAGGNYRLRESLGIRQRRRRHRSHRSARVHGSGATHRHADGERWVRPACDPDHRVHRGPGVGRRADTRPLGACGCARPSDDPRATGASPTRGLALCFRLSVAANAQIRLVRLVGGHRRGGACRAGGRGPTCTSLRSVVTLHAGRRVGAYVLALTRAGRGWSLTSGRYEAVISARNAANSASKQLVVHFTVTPALRMR